MRPLTAHYFNAYAVTLTEPLTLTFAPTRGRRPLSQLKCLNTSQWGRASSLSKRHDTRSVLFRVLDLGDEN